MLGMIGRLREKLILGLVMLIDWLGEELGLMREELALLGEELGLMREELALLREKLA